jgi:predicted acyltransferase
MSGALDVRYKSVDAMRGLTVAGMLLVNNQGDWNHVYAALVHSPWDGCSIADFVFPFFLFLVGVSISLYKATMHAADAYRCVVRRRLLWRSAKLVLAGLLLNAAMMWTFHTAHFFVMGTLQRIGICYMTSAWVALYLQPRMQWGIMAILLPGYAWLLQLGGSYAPFENMADRLDDKLLNVHALIIDPLTRRHRDPNGLLSSLGALTTTLIGVRAGDWMRRGKTRHLWMAGLIAVVAGYAWSYGLPINKKMWTGSFVLWTGGWAMLGLGLYHELIDRRGWPAVFCTLGVNAFAAYIGSLFTFLALYRIGWWKLIYGHAFAAWPIGPFASSLCHAAAFAGIFWLILKWFDRRGWHLKV